MSFYHPVLPFTLRGKTLVVPVVSIANIAQLAVDLLIASLSLRRIGVFDSRDLVPVIGGREGGEDGITMPLELFGREGCEIVVIQQRSPVLVPRKQEFIESLFQFVREHRLSAVLILSGVDMSDRTDAQMMTPTYYIRPPNSSSWENSPLFPISQLPIPEYTSPVSQHPGVAPQTEGPIPFIPGGGLTRRILSNIPADWNVPTAALLHFVLEGDNRSDASLMASVTAKVLSLEVPEWREPSSWQQGLFGTPHDQTLYG
ncbi:PAC2 family domain containing protein [Lactarius tabidus]